MKYLLARKGGKGLFLFSDNDCKFVVATIQDDNGIGEEVAGWHNGTYFFSLKEALEILNKSRK